MLTVLTASVSIFGRKQLICIRAVRSICFAPIFANKNQFSLGHVKKTMANIYVFGEFLRLRIVRPINGQNKWLV